MIHVEENAHACGLRSNKSDAMDIDLPRLRSAYETARDLLLAECRPDGDGPAHWTGELSTSALSTATAVMALQMVRQGGRDASDYGIDGSFDDLIRGGLDWLNSHQNEDGGWGDTVKSLSNISTTMLAHAVFHATGSADDEAFRETVAKAEQYIDDAGGVPAVVKRYGKDKTFSVPILTHCALAGLVDWHEVTQLPFELSCVPARFYAAVKMPVVSYALPALIAIGQVRHHFLSTWNPITLLLRKLAIKPSLRVLERIQPPNGGFLEAAPLTSFVTMSLAGMSLVDHVVVQRAVRFLADSVRPDGSWPIDTNLATWTTTLSINALKDDVPEELADGLADWLLDQQYKETHPYTNAAPGGWAWTDLPGGVPDADDTSGAVLALAALSGKSDGAASTTAAHAGLDWLAGLANRDGGLPTFCRGWGRLPFDTSCPDITAHFLRAAAAWPDAAQRHHRVIAQAHRYLTAKQRADGSWLPLWFGNEHHAAQANPTYGTAKVVLATGDRRGVEWLLATQASDGGFGPAASLPASIEETALAVEAMASVIPDLADSQQSGETSAAVVQGLEWLMQATAGGSQFPAAPIGLYFAKLWYFEDLYPLSFTVAACERAQQAAGLRSD